MSSLDTVLGSLPGAEVTLRTLLRRMHAGGLLEPLVREALAEQLIRQQAQAAGLTADAPALQAAADAFRRRHGLLSAADTHAWLRRQNLSLPDFEARLEQQLVAEKFRDHLTADAVEQAFAAHRAGFERLRLLQVVLPREDAARELLSQVRDDGRELAEAARDHGAAATRVEIFRGQLPSPLGEALAGAPARKVVGPVALPEGFALMLVEEVKPAELDAVTRERIREELFAAWLEARMKAAALDFSLLDAP
jgi:parvulin-like peptidyl-prolyl isomerase